MKLALVRFIHLFMALIVLLSSTGFGLVEHSCQLRGKRVYSVHQTESAGKRCEVQSAACCQNSDKVGHSSFSQTDCCKDETRYSRVDTSSSLSQQLTKCVKAVGESCGAGVVAVSVTLLPQPFFQRDNVPVVDYSSPPPPFGRHLLAFVQSFLI